VSVKASGKNKHFKVQLMDNYCIEQWWFHSMDELGDTTRSHPSFPASTGKKLYHVRALQWQWHVASLPHQLQASSPTEDLWPASLACLCSLVCLSVQLRESPIYHPQPGSPMHTS
jgi:hypothetical protein